MTTTVGLGCVSKLGNQRSQSHQKFWQVLQTTAIAYVEPYFTGCLNKYQSLKITHHCPDRCINHDTPSKFSHLYFVSMNRLHLQTFFVWLFQTSSCWMSCQTEPVVKDRKDGLVIAEQTSGKSIYSCPTVILNSGN